MLHLVIWCAMRLIRQFYEIEYYQMKVTFQMIEDVGRMVSYSWAELWRFQLMNSIAKYMVPKENTRWKNPYSYGMSSSSWTSSLRNWIKWNAAVTFYSINRIFKNILRRIRENVILDMFSFIFSLFCFFNVTFYGREQNNLEETFQLSHVVLLVSATFWWLSYETVFVQKLLLFLEENDVNKEDI